MPGLTSAERLVLSDLADYANTDTLLAWPSRERLCADLGLNTKTVQLAMRRLITLGYITQAKPAGPGRTRTLRMHPDTWPAPPEAPAPPP